MSIALGPLLTNLYPVKDGTDIEVDMSAGSEPEGPMQAGSPSFLGPVFRVPSAGIWLS